MGERHSYTRHWATSRSARCPVKAVDIGPCRGRIGVSAPDCGSYKRWLKNVPTLPEFCGRFSFVGHERDALRPAFHRSKPASCSRRWPLRHHTPDVLPGRRCSGEAPPRRMHSVDPVEGASRVAGKTERRRAWKMRVNAPLSQLRHLLRRVATICPDPGLENSSCCQGYVRASSSTVGSSSIVRPPRP